MTTKTKPGVVCAKCGELNPPGTNVCTKCGSRTYIACHRCGHSNERVATHCVECGHRLHRPVLRRLRKRLFGQRPKVTPFQIVLLVVFVLAAYKVVVYLAEYRPPAYQGE